MFPAITPLTASVLRKFWERTLGFARPGTLLASDWKDADYHLSLTGIGMEEALTYLCSSRPSFDEFMQWLQTSYIAAPGTAVPETDVLTPADRAAWNRDGYLVVKNVVTPDACHAVNEAIWTLLGASPAHPASWYTGHPVKKGMMLSFFQHTALEANRRNGRIRKVYEELYGHNNLYLPVDKVSFNPPVTATHNFTGSPLHWDVSVMPQVPYVLQGLLYLTDVREEEGAFHCVPGFHHRMDDWLASLPAGADPRTEAMNTLVPVPIPGNAGDMVIWHQALPHCATPNHGVSPRMVQYIAWKPMDVVDDRPWR